MTETLGIIVGDMAHAKNLSDGHTLPEVLDQAESIMEEGRPSKAIVDRGYRGRRWIGDTEIG